MSKLRKSINKSRSSYLSQEVEKKREKRDSENFEKELVKLQKSLEKFKRKRSTKLSKFGIKDNQNWSFESQESAIFDPGNPKYTDNSPTKISQSSIKKKPKKKNK